MKNSPLKKGIDGIIKEFKLPVSFPKKVVEEAEHLPPFEYSEQEGREDLRDDSFVTIDGEKARDFDDAVCVTRLDGGNFLLKVSIADVGFYVKPGSELDREAFQRATSSYFPDRVLPMFPEKLSNDLCSLVPNKDRPTFTAEMEFDAQGKRQDSRFYRSVIHSQARLTYTIVSRVIEKDPETRAAHASQVSHIEDMWALAEALYQMRRARGTLDFDLPEPLIEIDMEEGSVLSIVKAERNKAHRLIEEFMIAANEAVAEWVTARGEPMMYRIHDEPATEAANDLATTLHNMGLSLKRSKKWEPRNFAAVIESVRGRAEERMVNTLLLRTMKQAIYHTHNTGHFGLASECYVHFTSPIRRYPDLTLHRVLLKTLGGDAPRVKKGGGHLTRVAAHCSERERNSMKAEWATRDLANVLFMKKHIGNTYDGVVADVTKFGFFVELVPYFVRGLVPLRKMDDDYYIFIEKSHALVGRRSKKKFTIGQKVRVKVSGVNFEKRWVDFELDRV